MRIQILCPHFAPDNHSATGVVMTALVENLVEEGHEVDVVTSLPWYRRHEVEAEWQGRPWRRERQPWGTIVRIWPFPTNKTNIPARAAGFAGFTALAVTQALRLPKPDVVMAMSPPIFLGDAGWLVAKRWRVPLVFNTQDIFPDVAVDLGALTNRWVIALARLHERLVYRRANAVTVLSDDQASNIRFKMPVDRYSQVHLIPNFVDSTTIIPGPKDNWYREKYDLTNKRVIMYSGNVGLSQSFDLIREAATHFGDRPDVHFVINGEGAARPQVDEWARDCANLTVANFVSREQVPDLLAAGDIHLVLLKSGLARSSTPSKLYGILAAGRPILASIDEGSEVASVVEKAGAGLAVPPDNAGAFIRALEEMLDAPTDLEAMGKRAREFIETWPTPQEQAKRYSDLFGDLVAAT